VNDTPKINVAVENVKSEVKVEVQGGPEKEQIRKEIEKLMRENNKEREHVIA
jgi:hypothetical protein